MKPFAPFAGLPIGLSASFWFVMGLLRLVSEQIHHYLHRHQHVKNRYAASEIAAIIPAHNEELAIRKCIQALKMALRREQIHVVSDGSTDKTYRRARMEGCHVSRLSPGQGKAKAIIYTIRRYDLYRRFKFIFIVDADTRIDRNFIHHALPIFNDLDIGVVFGTARINWPAHFIPRLKYYYVAYRERLNRLLMFFFIFGQTWKYTNTSYVVPGFATLWRSAILKRVKIDTPGLLIEDFNTAFQIHKKRICKIGFNPSCVGWDQHPETLTDYWNQVKRWNIGFFQTVKLNGFWPSFYWLSLSIFTLEVFLNSVFIIVLPLLVLYIVSAALAPVNPVVDALTSIYRQYGLFQHVKLSYVFLTLFFLDYMFTVIIGLVYKKPQFLIYGLGFFFMHYVTALILLFSLTPGFSSRSEGRWTSPTRSKDQLSVKI